MSNPSFSEMILKGIYGPESDADLHQSTKIYSTVSEDSTETDHKFLEEVYDAGKYFELAHYASVKQIVIQNISDFAGISFHLDALTGAVVPVNVVSGEHICINNPDVTVGLMLYALAPEEATRWHLAVIGRLA